MVIGLDYDCTFTADPEFWKSVLCEAKKYGHTIIIVTARYDNQQNRDELSQEAPEFKAYFAGSVPKLKYMMDQKIDVDVWIDDDPGSVMRNMTAHDW